MARVGFPRSFTAADDRASAIWRREYIRTVVERDVPKLGMNVPAPAIYRFWSMLAHHHGPVWHAPGEGAEDLLSRHRSAARIACIAGPAELPRHPKSGASWEGVALEQVLRVAQPDEAWFWATHAGAQLDLLMIPRGRRIGSNSSVPMRRG